MIAIVESNLPNRNSMLQSAPDPQNKPNNRVQDLVREALAELATRLDIPHENARIAQALIDASVEGPGALLDETTLWMMMRAGTALGLRLAPVEISPSDAWEVLRQGTPLAILALDAQRQECAWILSPLEGGRSDATCLTGRGAVTESFSERQVTKLLKGLPHWNALVAQPSLLCDPISSHREMHSKHLTQVTDDHDSDHHGEHLSPFRRFTRLLSLEARDVRTLGIFTVVVSFLNLATPLAVEQMVTTIGFASVIQPMIWIAVLLFAILTLSAIIKALQLFVVEIIQRRMMVRVVGDLAERFPRLERTAMDGIHGPELANRFFDVMTIQKATASLLMDLLSLTIQSLAGLLLLAVYSPYLLAFDIILISMMTLFLYGLGRGAVGSAIEESLIKYRLAHWLQDVIGNPNAFQVHGAGELAVDRANRLVVEYLGARRKHFVVLMRQSLFALMLYAISIASLLSLGGWLVISNALTMGQLVASVSVVAVVVGAFSQVGKSLESFYDLMAATDKVGHLIDLPTIPPSRSLDAGIGPVELRFRDLCVGTSHHHHAHIPNVHVAAGQRVALIGEGRCGKTTLLQTLSGLRNPASGLAEIGGIDSRDANRFAEGSMVSIAADIEIFHGTIREAVSLNRVSVSQEDIRDALQTVELWDEVLAMPNGLDTQLQTGGYPLSRSQAARLMLARAIVAKPRLLLIDGTLECLPTRMRQRVWNALSAPTQPWTMIVVTHDINIINACDKTIELVNSHHDHTH